MAHLYKCTVWSSPTGKYHCGDVSDLANNSNAWWIPCNILGMKPYDFVLLLKETFNASDFYYNVEKNVLMYSWNNKNDVERYKNWINEMSKKANAII